MKRFSIGAILVTAFILFTGHWYYRASEAKECVIKNIAQFQERNEQKALLTYKDIHVHGYPFKYIVTLVDPVFAEQSGDNEEPVKIGVKGKLDLGADLFFTGIWAKLNGEISISDEQYNFPFELNNGNTTVLLAVDNKGKIKDFCELFSKGLLAASDKSIQEQLWDLFEKLEITRENIEVTKDEKKLFSIQGSQLTLTKYQTPAGLEEINLEIDVESFNITNLIHNNPNIMDIINQSSLDAPTHFNLSMNLELPSYQAMKELLNDFSIEKLETLPKAKFAVHRLKLRNEFLQNRYTLRLEMEGLQENSWKIHFVSGSEDQFSKSLYQHSLDNLNEKILHPENLDESSKQLVSCCADQLREAVIQWDSFGEIKSNVEIHAHVSNSTTKGQPSKIIADINDLSIATDFYSLTSNGSFNSEKEEFHFVINLINYKGLVHDLTNYLNRTNVIYGLPKDRKLDGKRFINFIKFLSDDPKSDSDNATITIHIEKDPTKSRFGTKTIKEAANEMRELLKSPQ